MSMNVGPPSVGDLEAVEVDGDGNAVMVPAEAPVHPWHSVLRFAESVFGQTLDSRTTAIGSVLAFLVPHVVSREGLCLILASAEVEARQGDMFDQGTWDWVRGKVLERWDVENELVEGRVEAMLGAEEVARVQLADMVAEQVLGRKEDV